MDRTTFTAASAALVLAFSGSWWTAAAAPAEDLGGSARTQQSRILPGHRSICLNGESLSGGTTPAQLWSLAWDDSLDGQLEDVGKRCLVSLAMVDSTVTGYFVGDVLGSPRQAVFTGELVGGGALLLLQQREAGYVCSYQLSPAGTTWCGTWRDSQGRSGSARMALTL